MAGNEQRNGRVYCRENKEFLQKIILTRFTKILPAFLQTGLFKIFLSTGFATGIKVLATILLSKIVAVKLGPGGLAMLGQLSSFITIALLVSTGGFANGIIKYVAELKDTVQLKSFVAQSFKLTLVIGCITGVLLFLTSVPLSKFCFDDTAYDYVFKLLGITIIFYACGNYFVSFLNGIAAYKTFNTYNTINSIFSLIISVFLIQFSGLKGAFIAVALNQTISCLIASYFAKNYIPYFASFQTVTIKKEWVVKLLSYSSMALITALLVPTSQLYIRKMLINSFGIANTGQWEAINRISNLYLSILINIMLVYYLPKLSSLETKPQLKVEIQKGFKFFFPIVILLAASLFFLKDLIIQLFLSGEFIGIRHFFLPQLIGDVFKILSFLYAYLVIAKSLTAYFIVTEIVTTLMYVVLSRWLSISYGVPGVVYAYTITYATYFILQYFFIGTIYLNENINSDSFFRKGRRL
jgi:O-antigen/teichoic acid export membrane protein